jgi:TPP-dependent pyruvate/acetoin dehydrogenase alpha subunit
MTGVSDVRQIEQISAILEEQELTKEDLLTMIRQIIEIRAFENNIASKDPRSKLRGFQELSSHSSSCMYLGLC